MQPGGVRSTQYLSCLRLLTLPALSISEHSHCSNIAMLGQEPGHIESCPLLLNTFHILADAPVDLLMKTSIIVVVERERDSSSDVSVSQASNVGFLIAVQFFIQPMIRTITSHELFPLAIAHSEATTLDYRQISEVFCRGLARCWSGGA